MQPDYTFPSTFGNIAVNVHGPVLFGDVDVMSGYRPALGPELSDSGLAQKLHDHGIAAAGEVIPRWQEAGLMSPDRLGESLYGLPPYRYTLFYWTSDGGSEYGKACGWGPFGGIYAVSIGMYGDPDGQAASAWPTAFRESAVTAYLGHPQLGDRDLAASELDVVKSELSAAASSVFERMS